MAVSGRIFTRESLKAAIQGAKGSAPPIHLILRNETAVVEADVDYHEGERYPLSSEWTERQAI